MCLAAIDAEKLLWLLDAGMVSGALLLIVLAVVFGDD